MLSGVGVGAGTGTTGAAGSGVGIRDGAILGPEPFQPPPPPPPLLFSSCGISSVVGGGVKIDSTETVRITLAVFPALSVAV